MHRNTQKYLTRRREFNHFDFEKKTFSCYEIKYTFYLTETQACKCIKW